MWELFIPISSQVRLVLIKVNKTKWGNIPFPFTEDVQCATRTHPNGRIQRCRDHIVAVDIFFLVLNLCIGISLELFKKYSIGVEVQI
jgi:hypothetical protein